MSGRGVHFALHGEALAALRALPDGPERLDYVAEEIEETLLGGPYAAESDRAWEAIQRALADGQLTGENGGDPLRHVILGGENLYSGPDYILSLKTPAQVSASAAALAALSEANFRARYFAIPAAAYSRALSADDLAYTWTWLTRVVALFETAAATGRYVLFTVDLQAAPPRLCAADQLQWRDPDAPRP